MEVRDGVRTALRIEGFAILTLCVVLYAYYGAGWIFFAALILVPDLSMLGYLASPSVGAKVYNAGHLYIGPVLLWLSGAVLDSRWLTAAALIWGAHIGIDRALGYGLKYPTAFGDTHLGKLGKPART